MMGFVYWSFGQRNTRNTHTHEPLFFFPFFFKGSFRSVVANSGTHTSLFCDLSGVEGLY